MALDFMEDIQPLDFKVVLVNIFFQSTLFYLLNYSGVVFKGYMDFRRVLLEIAGGSCFTRRHTTLKG